MYRNLFGVLIAVFFMTAITACGSSGSDITSPGFNSGSQAITESSQRTLWGFWDVEYDVDSGSFNTRPLRTAEFTANVNSLLEGKPGNLIISDIDASNFFAEGRLDATITLAHPLVGIDMYHGFDVWGVFMHNGETELGYDGLVYADGTGADDGLLLNPDGWTRWFNYEEFSGNSVPLMEYTPGLLSSIDSPTATLNSYKVFADGLDEDDDYHDWLMTSGNMDDRGIYRAGELNSRRYEMQFPFDGPVPKATFQYCVIATWEPGDPELTGLPCFLRYFRKHTLQ